MTSKDLSQIKNNDTMSVTDPTVRSTQEAHFPPACSLFYFESIFLHQKGSTIMTKLTYTLAIINGTVCYECQPSTPHAFYSGGGWFAPFCTVLELTRKNTVKA
jgi:hypothetical protein